ncbi:MAG: putative Ig domain-containing protein [Archangiaceae bacterium]|nr:putative Ig domain-containing protein [Archangiaceae bacterium]
MARVVVALAVLSGGSAFAQNYVVQSQAAAYVPMTGGTPITTWTQTGTFSATDEGFFQLPLGFTFPYYGNNYTDVFVDTNGYFTFGARCTSSCFTIRAIPNTTGSFHNVIAPWFGDLNVAGATVQYKGSSSDMEIEFLNVPRLSGGANVTFKLKLTAGGVFQVHFGTLTGATNINASSGFENSTGSMGAAIAPCGGACNNAAFPANTLVTVGQPAGPDLIVQTVSLGSVTKTGGNLSLTINPTFRNFGLMNASGFVWKAYLSADRLKDVGDTLVLTSTTPLNCAAGATVSDSASATIPAPATGNYYVLVEADTANAVNEGQFGEDNNVGASANYFVSGLDLVTNAVSGPAMSGPGNMMTVHVDWFNQGTDSPTQPVEFGVYLSTDNVWSTSDFALYTSTRTVTGGQTVVEDVTFPVPANVPGGDFFYILKVDPNSLITESSETNNAVTSTAKVTVRQADLVIKSVDFVDAATGVSVRHGVFGTPSRVIITAANEGGADARNFKVGVAISTDANLSLLNDTIVVEASVTQILQGTTVTLDVPFTMPENDRNNRPFTTGNYFFFGMLDSSLQITELAEGNNNLMVMQPVLMSSPAPDLTVVRFDSPSAVGVGEIAPVYRVFKNIGPRGASDVRYQYFISANAQVTVDDTLVKIVDGASVTDFGSVPMPAGAVATATEFIQLPANITPGTYYLGAVLDSDSKVVELDETNNSLGSTAVTVAASSLRVTTPSLPDAVIGRPYSFQLSVQGEAPGMPTTWAIDAAQGSPPMGITLSTTGLLSGTPTVETVVGITVVATNNMRTAQARFALRVLPTTTQVEITTPSLPSVVNSTSITYETWLGAAGGAKPYAWRLVPVAGEALPRNLTLAMDGRLSGVPATGIMEKAYPITVEVRDALGTTAQRKFNLRVVAPGAIIFTNLAIPDGLVGSAYLTDIAVKNFDQSPLSKPLIYRLIDGALPEGVQMVVEQDVLLLQGTPTVASTYGFTIEVEDSKGRTDSADFLMRVYPSNLTVRASELPTLHPGDTVDFSFTANGTPTGVTFKLYSGGLPPGATLGTDGHVTGMVAATDSEGTYNFVVEASDTTGASGIGAFSLQVKREIVVKGCGCGVGGGLEWLAMMLLPLVFRRRLRR